MKRLFFHGSGEAGAKWLYLMFNDSASEFRILITSRSSESFSEIEEEVSNFVKTAENDEKEAFYEFVSMMMEE